MAKSLDNLSNTKVNSSSPISSVKEAKDAKCPVIISRVSGCLDSCNLDDTDECLMTIIELNDGIKKSESVELCHKSLSEKPKKFRISIVKPKIDLERRKIKLLEEKQIFESRLKRFPGYIIGNLKCISQGDYEPPVSSNNQIEPQSNNAKNTINSQPNMFPTLPKLKTERIIRKFKYTIPEEAVKFYDNLVEIKVKSDEDFDVNMMRKFPLGHTIHRDKIHLTIIYVPECEILRKQFIGYYGLNFQQFGIEEFENWCHKNYLFNSKWMYESYFENGKSRECNFVLKGLMTKYQVGVVISDFFRTQDFATHRAIAVFGESIDNVLQCIEEFKLKLPVNITPYLQETLNDETSLAPNDFEEIDYFRRNYHRLMFSEDFYF